MRTKHVRWQRGVVLLWLVFVCVGAWAQEESPWRNKPTFSTDPADSESCEKQLSRVYTALEQFYKEKHAFPNQLSELIPDFLHDRNELICPYVKRTGDLTSWRLQVDQAVFDDPRSSYAYEFSNKPSNWIPNLTVREVKQHQMTYFGFGMPIVRCFAHRPRLNLACNGDVYRSNFEWEDAYLTCLGHQQAFHANLANTNDFAARLVAVTAPPRAYMDLTDGQLDLTKYYNAPLFHLTRMDRRGQVLATYPMSAECIGGVLFDVRALIHLGGQSFPIAFPLEIGGIRVDAACKRMHFLLGTVLSPHAAPASLADGATNAVFSIHFADGKVEVFPVLYGRDVKTLWSTPEERSASGPAKAAWTCALPGFRTAPRLYVSSWTNPYPDRVIGALSLRSEAANCAPFLVAVTLDDPALAREGK